ncbi:MAG: pyruvate kinase [Rhizobiales bacterium]|nr:pyruvate kinase [Hyphomicrobiales bacterium]
MRRNRRAKIVATLGPASEGRDMMRALIEAGVDVFRLNFSHGTREDHRRRYDTIRDLEIEVGRPVSVLQDLQGPKIRVGRLPGGVFQLVPGEVVRFEQAREASPGSIPLPHPEVFDAVAPGHHLLIDDGRRRLEIVSCDTDTITARVVYGGKLTDNKGVNLPDSTLPVSPLTPKDHEDLRFGLELGVDWVALSFVQRPADVMEARDIIGDRAGIMVKIEKPAALTVIGDIINLSDAVMVARGDLGVECPPEDVPGHQKELVRACRLAGKPVIIATQMLDSMMHAPAPTRAEASDIATAIYDGADAVMLSGETASGDYPLEAVRFMDRAIVRTENHKDYRSIITALEPVLEPTIQHSVSAAAADVAGVIDAKAIVAFTSSGATASRIARRRPASPILAITASPSVVRRMVLLWGAHSVPEAHIHSFEEMVDTARKHAIAEGFATRGDHIVIVAGVPFGVPGSTNNLRVVEV